MKESDHNSDDLAVLKTVLKNMRRERRYFEEFIAVNHLEHNWIDFKQRKLSFGVGSKWRK